MSGDDTTVARAVERPLSLRQQAKAALKVRNRASFRVRQGNLATILAFKNAEAAYRLVWDNYVAEFSDRLPPKKLPKVGIG
jgi:hypothetical protein